MRIVVAGAGETGIALAAGFSAKGWDVVMIDVSAHALGEVDESLDVMNIVGDATHRPVLKRAGAPRADAFVSVSGSDGRNLLSAALARQLGAKVAIARVDDPGFFGQAVRVETGLLGVDAVICTPRLVAARLLDRVLSSHFDIVDSFALHGVRVGVLSVAAAPSLVGSDAAQVKLPKGAHVSAVVRAGYVRPVSEVGHLNDDDRLVIAGLPDAVAGSWSQLIPGVADTRAVIVGGGDTGVSMLELLAPHIGRLELVELDRERARCLAEEYSEATILCGDGRRHAFLEDIQISSAACVIATTFEDETGLLIALLARRLGVPQTFTFIRHPGHEELFQAVGIEGATKLFDVLARAATDSIIGHGVVRRVSVPGTAYELIEWRMAKNLGKNQSEQLAGVALDELPLPARCRAVAAAHQFQSIPLTQATRLHPGDSLVLLVPESGVAELERKLARFEKRRRK